MQVERQPDATSFLERAGEFLLEREAQHNLILGLSSRLRNEPRPYGEDPYFVVVLDGDRVVGAAMRTPPHNLILSEIDGEAALEPIADDARSVYELSREQSAAAKPSRSSSACGRGGPAPAAAWGSGSGSIRLRR